MLFCTLDGRESLGARVWSVVDRIMAPQRGSNLQNLGICDLTWKKGLCRYVQLRIRDGERVLNGPGRSNIITRVGSRGSQDCSSYGEDHVTVEAELGAAQ